MSVKKYDKLKKNKWISKEKSATNKVKHWGNPKKKMLTEKLDNKLAKLLSAESNLNELEYGDNPSKYTDKKANALKALISSTWNGINWLLDYWNGNA